MKKIKNERLQEAYIGRETAEVLEQKFWRLIMMKISF